MDAGHSPTPSTAQPSPESLYRKNVHPSMNLELRLGLQWEYWCKGSPWKLEELGEPFLTPVAMLPLNPFPCPRSASCLSPSQQNYVIRMLLLPGRRGN